MKPIKLSKLLYNLYDSALYTDPTILGLALNSQDVKPGDLFFACKGQKTDGRQFIDVAIQKGAKAVLAEVGSSLTTFHSRNDVPIFPLRNLRQYIGQVASQFYGEPSHKLNMVGITGTNGKTSCSHFIAQIFAKNAIRCGVLGTLGNGIYGNLKSNGLTTPDPLTLQAQLALFVQERVQNVAMEVSSHSLEQGRVNGIQFKVGVFTNLTRDHLDYHKTLAAYGAAKRRLFENSFSEHHVINADDKFGQRLIHKTTHSSLFAYSLNKDVTLPKGVPLIFADNLQQGDMGFTATLHTPWGAGEAKIPLIGQFNLSNILAVVTSLCLLEVPFATVLAGISQLKPVSGRMESWGGNEKPLVIVDYSHTPDSLEKVLQSLRAHTHQKLFCLFGCGGDRDAGKRPQMAKIAERYADYVMVTDDNPRTEDPEKIAQEIMQGFAHPDRVKIEHDRAKAIDTLIKMAKPGDCVLVAGRGGEVVQIVGNKNIPFSDTEKVKKSLDVI